MKSTEWASSFFPSENSGAVNPGITKRDAVAIAAMHAVLSRGTIAGPKEGIAKYAYEIADAMINQSTRVNS